MVKSYTNKKNNHSRKNKTRTQRTQNRNQKGGMGAAIETALVPFGLLALQKFQQRKSRKTARKSRKVRRKSKK